jgi:hypothetical protein
MSTGGRQADLAKEYHAVRPLDRKDSYCLQNQSLFTRFNRTLSGESMFSIFT